MNDLHKNNQTSLADSVMERIESESVTPTPKYWYQCQECLTWLFWILSVLVGALAVAVICFVATHNRYAMHELTHSTPFTFVVEILPFVWIGLFLLMTGLAYWNLKQTKRGYKFPFTKIVVSSFLFSTVGGVLLHLAGVGFLVDTELGKKMGIYRSQEKVEEVLWQRPMEGRLIGMVATGTRASITVAFVDIEGTRWRFDISELREPDLNQLFVGGKVRTLGVAKASSSFHACGVFPWMLEKPMTGGEMKNVKQAFEERIFAHSQVEKDHEYFKEAALSGRTMGLCKELAITKRIKEKMKDR